MPRLVLPLLVLALYVPPLTAGEAAKVATDKTAADLAEQARPSVAVVLYTGRDGKQIGMGTGFVVSADGLIATNLHVIGEGRPIAVRLHDGKRYEVTAVHASDRKLDLAIIRIAVNALTPLPLGHDRKLKIGVPLVTLGHPRGLEYSVVAGVLSGRRDVDGLSMLQLAVPIEEGNSGGPVLDRHGRVVGVVTMRSLVTNNLGFAVPVSALRTLLERPNSIPMDQWLTLGALDKSEWKVDFGGRWRQRAGRIIADGMGTGFGGRTVCVSQRKVPAMPFELAVTIKLDNESGAAGLIFGGEAGGRHYGFYPSGGKLRLTRFDGPSVYSWKVVKDIPHAAYQPGAWNTLKVRVEKDCVRCYVNGQLVTELAEPDLYGSLVGLAKFRQTVAEFKRFQVGKTVGTPLLGPEIRAAMAKVVAQLPEGKPLTAGDVPALAGHPAAGATLLRDRARALEEQAARLRQLAQGLQQDRCLAELTKLLNGADKDVDLLRAALLVARLDNEELDVDAYVDDVARMAKQIAAKMPAAADPQERLAALNRFLFAERGFHGSRAEYYARSNSYLNEVIDDREGLPLTLSILYLELARRLDLPAVGVGLPGHFVVRFEPSGGAAQLIDVFDAGKPMTKVEAGKKVLEATGAAIRPGDLKALSKKAIVNRLLHNLIGAARREKDGEAMLRYLDAILAIDADAHRERRARAMLRFGAGQHDAARSDCEYLLERVPAEIDVERVRDLHRSLMDPSR